MGKYLDIVKRFERRPRTEVWTSQTAGLVRGPVPGISTETKIREPEHHPQVPYLNEQGMLIVPIDSHPRYHWWSRGGLSIHQTLFELGAPPSVLARYVDSEASLRKMQ
jgi:hypothetical protein